MVPNQRRAQNSLIPGELVSSLLRLLDGIQRGVEQMLS